MKRVGLCLVDDDDEVVAFELMRMRWDNDLPSGDIRIATHALKSDAIDEEVGMVIRAELVSFLTKTIIKGEIVKETVERLILRCEMEEKAAAFKERVDVLKESNNFSYSWSIGLPPGVVAFGPQKKDIIYSDDIVADYLSGVVVRCPRCGKEGVLINFVLHNAQHLLVFCDSCGDRLMNLKDLPVLRKYEDVKEKRNA